MQLKGYLVFDKETTITSYMKRKASPFCPENWVVANGFLARQTCLPDVDEGAYHGINRMGDRGWLAHALTTYKPKWLVGFNIKFDLLWSLLGKEDHDAFMAWVVAGGELWDTQLVEYRLDGMVQESQMLSLDEVAVRYGGHVKIDEVKAMWKQGINTHEIPQQLLMDYLMGRMEDGVFIPGDIHNTELIFKGQVAAATKRGNMKDLRLQNGALAATVEMERNGLWVNQVAGRKQAEVLAAEAARLKAGLQQYLPKDLPFEFNWGSRKQLSAFIFGGFVPFKQRVHQVDEVGKPAYAKMDDEQFVLAGGTTMNQNWWHHCNATEWAAGRPESMDVLEYGSGKKKGQAKTKKVKVDDPSKPKLKWETFQWKFAQITEPHKKWAAKEPGYYSTAGEVIEELGSRDIPFLKDFSNLAAISKDLGTYYIVEEIEVDDDGNETVAKAKGMLTLVKPDGIVNHNVNMTNTVTGRFAHDKPNMGNLPRGDDNSAKGMHTSLVKEMFESRWGEEGRMGSSDFTSLEVYCQAQLTKDKQLIADLRAGLDMHCKRLATVENKPYEEVLVLCKGSRPKDGPEIKAVPAWVVKRTNIKGFSFQRAYGAGAAAIAAYLKVPVEDVKGWIKADEAYYWMIPVWQERMAKEVAATAVPTAKWVQHPITNNPVNLCRGHYTTWDGARYVFQETCAPDFVYERDGTTTSFKPTELKNYPVQGTGAQWMKAAMWLALKAFYTLKNFNGKALLINTVHDALYWDSHSSVTRESGALIHACMLGASDFLDHWFGAKIEVPVPAETTAGKSMAAEEHFPDAAAFEARAEVYRKELRKQFMNDHQPSYL